MKQISKGFKRKTPYYKKSEIRNEETNEKQYYTRKNRVESKELRNKVRLNKNENPLPLRKSLQTNKSKIKDNKGLRIIKRKSSEIIESKKKIKSKTSPRKKINNSKYKTNKKKVEDNHSSNLSSSFNADDEKSNNSDSYFSVEESHIIDESQSIVSQGDGRKKLKKNKYKTPVKLNVDDNEKQAHFLNFVESNKKQGLSFFETKPYIIPQSIQLNKELDKIISSTRKTYTPVKPTRKLDRAEIERIQQEEIEKEINEEWETISEDEMMEDPFYRFSPTRKNQLTRNELQITSINLDTVRIPKLRKRFIDLKAVSLKEKITNVELLFSILEIAKNYKYYHLNDFSNRSKCFWENVIHVEELKKIFDKLNLNAETLRKYWRVLKTVKDIERITECIKFNKEFIEDTGVKVKYLVDLIREFDNRSSNEFKFISFFEENYQNYCCKKLDEFSHREEGTTVDERVILEKLYRPFTKEKEMMEESEKKAHQFQQSNFEIKKTIETDYDNIDSTFRANQIREKIKYLVDKFPCYEEVFLKESLEMGSFDVDLTEEFLIDPKEMYKRFVFLPFEDYIILNMKNSYIFELILKKKGIELVKNREKYLKEKHYF